MFTGIIESLGNVQSVSQGSQSSVLKINPLKKELLEDVKLGDSIAVNGVCLTVTWFDTHSFQADVMSTTLKVTSLSYVGYGEFVNLERAMKASDRFGGHIVSGHIDGTGIISNIKRQDISYLVTIKVSPEILKYIILRGSVCLDGISLTVSKLYQDSFQVSIIPHTFQETNLSRKKVGDFINIENDMIGKYVERLLQYEPMKNHGAITKEFLQKHGF